MKRLITILLFAVGIFGLAVKTKKKVYFTVPVKPYVISPGEYYNTMLDGSNATYDMVGIPNSIGSWPSGLIAIASGTHGRIGTNGTTITVMADNNFSGWKGDGTTGSGGFGPFTVTADSLGNTFSNIILVGSGGTLASNGWTFWMVEQGAVTDTLFAVGATDGGLHFPGPASGFNTKWVKIGWVTGKHIKKVQMDVIAIMLMTDGTAYDWGGSTFGASVQYILGQGSSPVTNTPTLIPVVGGGGHTWKDISGGSFWNYWLRDDGRIYGSAYYAGYLGAGQNGQAYNQPTAKNTLWDLNDSLNLPAPTAQITTTMTSTYVILTNGQLWAWGDNACGTLGIGTELDFSATTNPYQWDQGLGEKFRNKPIQVAAGKSNFKDIFGTNALAPYVDVTDSNGDVFDCGRGKGGILTDGSVGAGGTGNITATYPNGNDNYYLKKITPFATSTFPVSAPYCKLNPATSPCNDYTLPANGSPVTVYSLRYAVINGLPAVISDLHLSTDLGHFIHQFHRQVSGPALQMGCQDQPIDTIYGVVPGQTYQFRGTTQNQTFDSTAVVLSFTVPNSSLFITRCLGCRVQITNK